MASEHNCCGDARLGKLQVGTHDVLFQLLQRLTVMRYVQTGRTYMEKIDSAEFVGVPDCQGCIRTSRHNVA